MNPLVQSSWNKTHELSRVHTLLARVTLDQMQKYGTRRTFDNFLGFAPMQWLAMLQRPNILFCFPVLKLRISIMLEIQYLAQE